MPRASDPESRRFAVLIDGDNAQPRLLAAMMEEVGRHGSPTVRRIYGDWASGRLNGWKDDLHYHAFQAVQQHSFARGKNSTDGRLIIEAMDLLHTAPIDAFCIISSDSDYAGLAKRLRESGKFVLGIGERKTPDPFVRACDQFTFTDLLVKQGRKEREKDGGDGKKRPRDRALRELLIEGAEAMEREDGYANLGRIAEFLQKKDPGFDPRSYGRSKVSQLFREFPETFEFDPDDPNYVRILPEE
ncbi:MAG TPA: NYN domain-containing protein [Candidatus Thermoplasmatota archaeon]|nr:NYN domain-containing protein [Candidatus Thermoplasmatota archaeon]